MKKIYLLFLLTTTVCFSQVIHPIPDPVADYYFDSVGDAAISDNNILIRINTILNNLDVVAPGADPYYAPGNTYTSGNYGGVPSVYFSKRILAHIQLYHYYTNQGDTINAATQIDKIEEFFGLLLDEQCISYNTNPALICASEHGGFPANYRNPAYNDDINANPIPTSSALKVFAEVRNLYDSLGLPVPIISCDEFEDRVYQAKHALYSYQQINQQYINLTSFTQIAATSIHDLYDDEWSMDFLIEKATELFEGTGPLRPIESGDPNWGSRDWGEGIQPDGSWKDYGLIPVSQIITSSNECEKWHDSELDYHATITEGLIHLYHRLEPGVLKTKTKTHLIASINHIIDYNGQTTYLEHPFNEDIIEDQETTLNDDYAQTRLTGYGRITKYHRELSEAECTNFDYDKRVVGIGFLRSLIFAKNYLDGLTTGEHTTLDELIAGLTLHMINTGDPGGAAGTGAKNLPADQLYDLSLFLNMDTLHSIQKNISKDKAIAAYKITSNIATISSYKENTTLTLDLNQDFYTHNQEAVSMVAGDFNGNGSDELIVAFSGGSVYRYQENSSGNMAITSTIHSSPAGSPDAEKVVAGDFDGDGIDELIILFDNDNVKKYSEDSTGQLIEDDTFNIGKVITHLEVGDFNGDSIDELIIVKSDGTNSTMYRYYENSSGNIVQTEIIYNNSSSIEPLHIKAGNFDEDSSDELVIALSDGNITRYKEDSVGDLVTDINENFYQNNSILPIHLEVGDFNLDGEDELVIAFSNKHISIYEEDETTGYMAFEQNFYSGSQLCSGLSAGDFDGDGVDELLVGYISTVYRCIKNSAGVMQLRSSFSNNGDDINLITTLRRNRIHCPGGASSRATNTSLTGLIIQELQFDATLIYSKENFKLSIKNHTSENSTLEVYDITGRLLFNEKFEQSINIDKSKLTRGLHILIVRNGNDQKIIKMIN